MRHFSKLLPVSDDVFTPPHLTQKRLNDLRCEVRTALHNALDESNNLQMAQASDHVPSWQLWSSQAQFEGLSAFTWVHDLAPTVKSSRVCGTIQGNYMDIARFFKSETREKYFKFQKRLFPDTVDAAVLRTITQLSSRPSVYEGIKWAAYRPSWRRSAVDACVFESTGTGVSSDGRPYFYCVAIPTEFPEVPEICPARVDCKTVMILSPSVNNKSSTDVFLTMRTDANDRRMSRSFFKGLIGGLRNIGLIATKGHTPSFALRHGKWVLPELERVCSGCSRDFSVLRSKHECSICEEVVCRKCLLEGQSIWSRRHYSTNEKLRPTKVCKPCINRLLCEDGSRHTLPSSGEYTPADSMAGHPFDGVTTEGGHSTEEPVEDQRESVELCSYPTQSCISELSPQSRYSDWSIGAREVGEKNGEDYDQEDEHFFASGKSVLLTIDTSEMTQVSLLFEGLDCWAMSPCS